MFERWKSRKSSMPASKDSLPVLRRNLSLTNLQVLNAICMWPNRAARGGLPKRFVRWHTIYMRNMRMNRWAQKGVMDRVFEIMRVRIEAFSLGSTSVKVHPKFYRFDGTEQHLRPQRERQRPHRRNTGNYAIYAQRTNNPS
jgi:hypothetical protein